MPEYGKDKRSDMSNESQLWDYYNGLLLSPDVERVRKLLVRYELFRRTMDVPGDLVECGVFKGVGLMYWLKLLRIFAPGSRKRVIGFDTFGPFDRESLLPYERKTAGDYEAEAGLAGTSRDEVWQSIAQAGYGHNAELVAGDLSTTAGEYVRNNPGFRVSFLHLDADSYLATKAALEAFWPIMTRGGIVVLDEYADRGWGESDATDEFFADKQARIEAVPHSNKPTAYVVKG